MRSVPSLPACGAFLGWPCPSTEGHGCVWLPWEGSTQLPLWIPGAGPSPAFSGLEPIMRPSPRGALGCHSAYTHVKSPFTELSSNHTLEGVFSCQDPKADTFSEMAITRDFGNRCELEFQCCALLF